MQEEKSKNSINEIVEEEKLFYESSILSSKNPNKYHKRNNGFLDESSPKMKYDEKINYDISHKSNLLKNQPNTEKPLSEKNKEENDNFDKNDTFNDNFNKNDTFNFDGISLTESYIENNNSSRFSFRKNINKMFNINEEEIGRQFIELYFYNIFNFNNLCEEERHDEKKSVIENLKSNKHNTESSKIELNNSNTFKSNNNTYSFNNFNLNNFQIVDNLQFKNNNERIEFVEKNDNLISLLNYNFKEIPNDWLVNILNLLLTKNYKIHLFQFLNAFHVFNKIFLYMKYYNNMIFSHQYKSREFSCERMNNFYSLTYNRDFISVFKNYKTYYLDDQFDEFTDLDEISKNKRELKMDENRNY